MIPDTFIIGNVMIKLDAIGSTNDYAHDLLTKGEEIPEGTVVIAENQVAGRGQRGNLWVSEPGKNLTLSVVLKPKFLSPSDQFELSKAISVGIASYLREVLTVNMSAIRIKWPNDIYVGSDKICGILVENTIGGLRISHSIVGIGLNVNQEKFDSDLRNPTSMKLTGGKLFDINLVKNKLCSFLDKRYIDLRNGAYQKIDEEYLEFLYKYQEWGAFEVNGKAIVGKITGVTKSGKLILELEDGKEIQCDFKEVTFS